MPENKCAMLKGKAKELCKKNKLLIEAHLMNSITKDNYEHGAEIERWSSLSETITAKNMEELKKKLQNFGLELEEFRVFDEEKNRLTFNRNEDDDGNEITLTKERPDGYLVDYDIYIHMYEEIKTDMEKMGFKQLD